MKKLLLSLIMVVGVVLGLSATEVSTDWTAVVFNTGDKSINASSDGITVTVIGNGGTTPTQNPADKDVRCYAKNILTVSSTQNMTKCVFAISKKGMYRLTSQSTVDNGSLNASAEEKTVTWVGNAKSFSITVGANADLGSDGASKAGQMCFNSTVITLEGGAAVTTVSDPTFTPAAGTYTGTQNVAIKCATEGAAIEYSTDGTTFQPYTTPITVDKSMTLYAKATKSGLTASNVVSAAYVIKEAGEVEEVASIAEFLSKNTTGKPGTTPYKITGDLYVSYYGITPGGDHYLYVKDNTGELLIFGKKNAFPEYKNGDVISGVQGIVDYYYGYQMGNPEMSTFTAAKSNAPFDPMAVTIEDMTMDMLNHYVYIQNATYDAATKKLSQNGVELPTYSKFDNVTIPTSNGTYTVSGIVGSFKSTLQLYPIDFNFTSGVVNVANDNNANTIVANVGTIDINAANACQAYVFNAAGQVVVSKAVVAGNNTIALNQGFYIVKVGTTVAKVIVK